MVVCVKGVVFAVGVVGGRGEGGELGLVFQGDVTWFSRQGACGGWVL